MRRWSSHALRPFVDGAELPYRENDVLVTAVRPRPGVTWGTPVGRDSNHLIELVAGAWEPFGLVLGARWLCGATSIGVHLADPSNLWERYYKVAHKDDPEAGLETCDRYVCAKCRRVRNGEDPASCVYRVYDKRKRLLYIGSTKDFDRRRAQHRAQTWWWRVAEDVDLTYYPTLAEARTAEAEAIRTERPQMNIAHNREQVSS